MGFNYPFSVFTFQHINVLTHIWAHYKGEIFNGSLRIYFGPTIFCGHVFYFPNYYGCRNSLPYASLLIWNVPCPQSKSNPPFKAQLKYHLFLKLLPDSPSWNQLVLCLYSPDLFCILLVLILFHSVSYYSSSCSKRVQDKSPKSTFTINFRHIKKKIFSCMQAQSVFLEEQRLRPLNKSSVKQISWPVRSKVLRWTCRINVEILGLSPGALADVSEL